jgi:hypothetical protein
MAKLKTNSKFELMFLGAVVVIMAGFLIIFSNNSGPKSASAFDQTTLGVEVGDTSKDMMDTLKATNDDGGASEFNRLRNDASGL